jgi:glycosyltransferase involved in cell wall biosynthesis
VGGIPEAVQDGENGLLVENAAPDVAHAIERLARDPALARRLGEAGRATVLARFTVDHMVNRTLEIYRQVLSSWKS